MAGNSPRGQSPSPRPSHSPERYSSPPRRSPVSPLHTPRSSSPELLDRSPRPVHKPSSPIPVHDISDSENEPEIDSDQDEAREVYPIFSRHYGANASPAKRAKILRPSSRSNAPSSSRRPRADAHRTTKRSGHGSRARRRGEPRQHRSSAHVSGSRSKPRREHGQTSHAARLERDPEPAPRHPRRRRHDVGHNVTTFVTWSRLESGRVHRGPVNVDLEDEEVQQALARPRSLQAQPAHSRAVPPPSRIRPRPPPSRTHPQPVVLDARHPPPAPPFRSGVRPPPSRTRSHPVVFDRHSPPPSSQTSAHHADVPINADPPSTDRTRVELAKETAPLPGGHSLGQDSYLGKGWLRELLDCLTGDWKPHHVLLECRIDELPWSLASSSSVQNLSDFLGPACDAFFKFATSPLVQTELPVHMATMHRLCALVSWISLKAPPTGDEASWAKILACCTGLIHSIEQWHNFSTSALDVRHPYLYWFAVELLVRLHDRDPKNRPPLNANSKIPIAVQTGGLVQMLLRADYREKAFPPPGSIHLHNPAPLEDAVKSIWVCLIHVCNAFSDAGKRSSLPKFPPFWGLVADSWTATGDQSSDVAVSETVWHVVFALCPLTQYGPLGFSSSECHAPPPWRLVIHGISKIRLKGDHEQDARFPRTVLATRDDYIHTIVLRCLRLAQAWKWRADEKGYMIVDKLADIYRSRKFADLLGEHANFAPFVKENDPSLLKKPYDSSKDNTFSALLKLAYAIGSTREGQLTLTKLMAALVAVGRLQLSGEDLEPQQASALFNRFSAVALAVELDRSSAGFERRLQGLSSEVLFAESGEALRAICRQAVKHFTMQAIRVGVSLDAVLAWFGKMSACLVQEYCQGAHRPTTSPEYTKAQEAAKGIRKLLSLLAKAAAYSIEVEKVPNPKLLQCEGISEIFSIHQGNNILRPVGKSVQELVKVYLDFCQSELPPTPALADPAEKDNPAPAIQGEAVEPSTVVGGGNQGALTASTAGDLSKDPDIMAAVPIKQDDVDEDSQDYWKDDDLICFPELLALPEPSAPSQPTVEELRASSILDIVDERVQKPIFTLIGHFGVQDEAEEQLVRKEWIECWSHCMLALLHGGTKDLANCLTNRLSPWGSIPNPWRHYARLSVSYLVLSRYPAAYRHEHCRTFYVGVWLDCLVAYRPLGKGQPLEDRFMSLLLRVDKGQHPLLQNLPLDFQDDLTSESNVVQDDAFHNTVSAMSEIEDNRLHTGAASVVPFLVDMLQSMKCVSDTLQGEDEKRYRKFVHYVYESIESEPSFWSDSTVYNALSWTRAR
ncbi:Mus7/MMS22 family-domain-containing protein [Amylostereum chailletii]|nr:Mus7/MMS22 family-domain-containing protein [Amylostereum chailletii]